MIRINLLGEKRDNTLIYAFQLVLFGLSIAAVISASLFMQAQLAADLELAEREQALLTTRLEGLKKKTEEVAKLEEKKKTLADKLTTIAKLKAGRQVPVQVLDFLTRSIPVRAWLTKVTQNGTKLETDGLAVDPQTVSDFVSSLKSSPFFKEVEIDYSRIYKRDDVNLQKFAVIGEMFDSLELQAKLKQYVPPESALPSGANSSTEQRAGAAVPPKSSPAVGENSGSDEQRRVEPPAEAAADASANVEPPKGEDLEDE